MKIPTYFCSETTKPFLAQFCSQVLCGASLGRGDESLFADLGHMTKIAAMPIYGKNPSKNLLLQNRQADFYETWYVASGTPTHHSLFK